MSDGAMLALSGAMSSAVALLAFLHHCCFANRRAETPPGMDVLGKFFMDGLRRSKATAVYAALIWFAVCFLVDIVFPLTTHRAYRWDDAARRLQLLLALDYVVLAPVLVWCYISIASTLAEMEPALPNQASRNKTRRIYRFIWWIAVWAAGLLFQYATIRIQVNPCSSTPPWLWVQSPPTSCATVLHLNWQGAAHAALRGLDAMLGLGLAGMVAMAARRRDKVGGTKIMEFHGEWETRGSYIDCKFLLRRFCSRLVLAGFLAILIAGLHGLTIEMHRHQMDARQLQSWRVVVDQVVKSGWLIWGIVACVWAVLAGLIIAAIYRRACQELVHEEAAALIRRKEELPKALWKDVERERQRPSLKAPHYQQAIDQYWVDFERIRKYYRQDSRPYPLPDWLTFRWLWKQAYGGFSLGVLSSTVVSLAFATSLSGCLASKAIGSLSDVLFPGVISLPCNPDRCHK